MTRIPGSVGTSFGGAAQYLVIPVGTKAGFAQRAQQEAEIPRTHPPPPKMEAGPPPPKQGGKGGVPGAEEEDDVIMIGQPKPLGVKMPPPVKGPGGAKDAGKPPPAQPAKPPPPLSKSRQ